MINKRALVIETMAVWPGSEKRWPCNPRKMKKDTRQRGTAIQIRRLINIVCESADRNEGNFMSFWDSPMI